MESVASTMPPPKPYTVAIIGGGLAGVVLALGLCNHGVPFHIYEAASDFGEIGAGVALGPNAVRALQLVSPALYEAFQKHSAVNADPALADTFLSFRWGKVEEGVDSAPGDLLFHLSGGQRSCVHRAEFLGEIVRLLPQGSASFNKKLVAIEELPNTDSSLADKLLRFEDGSTAVASVIIGSDGVHSQTRRYLHGHEAAQQNLSYSGGYTYRALVPRSAVTGVLADELTRNGQIYIGRGGYVVTYPLVGDKYINMGANVWNGSASWPHKTWIHPATSSSPPLPGAGSDKIRADFAGWHAQLVDLLARYSPGAQWGLFDYDAHDLPYARGRVCLVGDAAHATTPHMGAGAGMAFEDAVVLSRLLGDTPVLEQVDDALRRFDAARRARSQRLVRLSRTMVQTYALLEDGVGADMGRLMAVVFERYGWLWNEDFTAVGDAQ